MRKRNWKLYRPISLQDAIEACVEFARERGNHSIERIAELMGMPSHWSLYKWIADASIPVRMIVPFENACGCYFVTQHLAASARKLLIDMPTGRKLRPADISQLQLVCNNAVNALIAFGEGRCSHADTTAALTAAMDQLAAERANLDLHQQPELALQ